MSKDPFQSFNDASVKLETSSKIIQQANNIINPNVLNLSLKYGGLFIMSIIISLVICPQRGVGLIRKDFPLFHHLLHHSETLCGLYCGFVFFITTHLLTFLLLNHFEKVKIVKHFSFLPSFFMSAFFGLSMTSFFSTADLGWSYNLSWLLTVGLSYFIANQLFLNTLKKTPH